VEPRGGVRPCAARPAGGGAGRSPRAGHRGRARRRNPRRRRDSQRHGVRPQPHGNLPLSGGTRRARRLPRGSARPVGGLAQRPGGRMSMTYWCELAWLPSGEVADGVLIRVEGTRIAEVTRADPPPSAVRLAGLTIPGLANVHSHAFHRALRAATQREKGSFWTWRERMYTLADVLDPDSYLALARAVYAEMALAGITCVGEFHYLHHGPGGRPYADRNAMAHALVTAARDAGVRIALLDACYLTGGPGTALTGAQLRFGDGDAERWAERVRDLADAYADADDVEVGTAVHSVRAVPPEGIGVVAAFSAHHAVPLHAHVSEQRAEN